MGIYYVAGMAYDSNYLEHHGIKGQKWGIRRFQNPDGTLTAAGKERYGKSQGNYFSSDMWKKDHVTNSEGECEYSAWEYFAGKGSEGNKKAIDDAMSSKSQSIDRLKRTAQTFMTKSKEDIDKYVEYEKDILEKIGLDSYDLGTNKLLSLISVEHPDYVQIMQETAEARKQLIQAINDSVDDGSFDSVFDGYPPVSYKDDKYGKKSNLSKTVDGRKAVIGSYINERYGNIPEYNGYGFEYLTPYDFEEWRNTKTGKLVKFD